MIIELCVIERHSSFNHFQCYIMLKIIRQTTKRKTENHTDTDGLLGGSNRYSTTHKAHFS